MAEQINNEYDLSDKIIENFKTPKKLNHQNINLLNSHGDKILHNTIVELNKLIKIKE